MQDLTGQTFGRYTVITPDGKTPAGAPKWLCHCLCGEHRSIVAGNLVSGHSRSCGCLRRDLTSAGKRTHAMCDTAEYRAWTAMKTRCYNKENASYANYGARGISICDRWRKSFDLFYADMGPRPTPDHSLDRIDNDGPYGPENCRWADRKQQARNTRHNTRVTVNGISVCLTEAAEILGTDPDTVRARVLRGWTDQDLVTGQGPRKKPGPKTGTGSVWLTYQGETHTLSDWARMLGIKTNTLAYRVANWTLERALTAPVQRYCARA